MLTKYYKVEESPNFSGVIRRGFSAKVIFQQKLEEKREQIMRLWELRGGREFYIQETPSAKALRQERQNGEEA